MVVEKKGLPTWSELTLPGRRAVRRYWRPFVFIQLGTLAAVVSYFNWPAAAHVFESLSTLKQSAGLIGAALAGGFAGTFLPEIAKTIALNERRFDARRWRTMGFHLIFFTINSTTVYLFYSGLTRMLGDEQTIDVVVTKVALDQLLYTPFFALPFGALAFAWRGHRYDTRALVRDLNFAWVVRHVVPLLPPCWCYWVPMTALIYSMPDKLQFVLFLFVTAAWSLVLVFIASGEQATDPTIDPEMIPVRASELS